MGVAGVAFLSLRDPIVGTDVDTWIGAGGLALAVAWALVLTVVAAARILRHRDAFLADLGNPGMGALVASWPAGLLILALALGEAGTSGLLAAQPALWAVAVAFLAGLAGTLLAGYAFYSGILHGEVPSPAVTGNWFVPVVPLVLVPSIVVRGLELGAPGAPGWAFVAIVAWGIGFFLFLLLASIIGHRLLMAAPPTAHQAPSWWIWLAPLGVGGVGLIASARLGETVGLLDGVGLAVVAATVLWGVAVWWALLAIRMLYGLRRDAHFHLGWWGFGFPTVALATLTLELGRLWGFGWMSVLGAVLWALALVVVVALAVRTVVGMRDGSTWAR